MKRCRLRGDRRGLTLIELVLTLTIVALAGALVSGALATGLRAWQSGLRSGREELVARIVLERIATQLRAAIWTPATRDGEAAVAFDAGDERLHFVTLAAAGGAPARVSYGLSGGGGDRQLVYREYPWPDKDFFGEGRPLREEKVAEVTGFAVKVVRRSDASGEPGAPDGGDAPSTALWSPIDEELPASVEVQIEVGGEGRAEPLRYLLLVPILVQRVP